MKIFDCFKFFNELELLDLRLMTLNDLVDYFVLVEANKTHTGKPKEFIFEQNKEQFKNYFDKIIYVKVEDLPDYSVQDIWKAENFQRNCISRGIKDLIKFGDKVIVSDIDEIPNPDTIRDNLDTKEKLAMIQHLFYYYVNCKQNQMWSGSVLATFPFFNSYQELRDGRTIWKQIPNGGWHYSFMGGPEKIRTKVENIAESHLIIDKVGTIEQIKEKIESQQDLWGRTEKLAQKSLVDITQPGMSPACIDKFLEKYPNFIWKTNEE